MNVDYDNFNQNVIVRKALLLSASLSYDREFPTP